MTDVQSAEVVLQAAINMISSARWRLTLDMFLQRLDAPDDDYWRAKFIEWAALSESLGKFDAHTLAKLCAKEQTA